MGRSTVDASVVLAWLLDEPRPRWVDETVAAVRTRQQELVAPSLIWLEIGNRLARARGVHEEFALEALIRAEALGVECVELGRPYRLRALQLAHEHRVSMYDAAYLAVAEATRTPLLTLDQHLERTAADMGLGSEWNPRRISEPSAPHGDRPIDRTSIAAIGAALAEMRRENSI
jgi:predicted nucleic acid-binding protein